MVLVHSFPRLSFPRIHSSIHPNPARIAGVSGAIALNIAVLMALMLPTDLPLPRLAKTDLIVVPLRERIDPPPKPPEVVPVTPPQARPPQPRSIDQRTATRPIDNPPVVTDAARALDVPYVPPVESATATDTATADIAPGPVAGVRLEYAFAPAPTYPRNELMAGREGTVVLQVLVDVDGSPLQVDVHTSSGNRNLDRAARQHVLKSWTFRAAMRNGQPVQAIGLVPIDFKLQ